MVQNNASNNRTNAIDSYYSNPNTATANAIANTNDYIPINARTLLQSIGLLPVDSNAITPTNPTPNNNLFSNIDEVFSFIDGTISRNRAENDYTIGKTREQMLWTDKAQRDRANFDDNLSYNRSVKDDKLQRDRANFDKDLAYKDTVRSDSLERDRAIFDKDLAYKDTVRNDSLERDRLSWDAKQEAEKTRQANFGKANQNYNDQVHLQRTRQLELERTRIDNENERNKQRNEMEKNNALYRNNVDVTRINADAQLGVARANADAQLDVARMNNEYGMQTTLLQGSQRQAELDKQGLIQLQLANTDIGQRGYDNMYSMLNQYTNRPRSNFAYWG